MAAAAAAAAAHKTSLLGPGILILLLALKVAAAVVAAAASLFNGHDAPKGHRGHYKVTEIFLRNNDYNALYANWARILFYAF
jgi:hypothetical protein